MRISTEPERCVGSGQCVMIAPDVFDQDDDGIVILLKPRPDADELADVQEAIRICPASAIAAGPAPTAESRP